MNEHDKVQEKEHGFMGHIKEGIGHVSNIISASVVPTIEEGARKVMKNIDDRILLIENRIIKKLSSLLIIGFGGIFLILALLFFLIDYLGWSHAVAFFSIGITIFVIGLILKIGDKNK